VFWFGGTPSGYLSATHMKGVGRENWGDIFILFSSSKTILTFMSTPEAFSTKKLVFHEYCQLVDTETTFCRILEVDSNQSKNAFFRRNASQDFGHKTLQVWAQTCEKFEHFGAQSCEKKEEKKKAKNNKTTRTKKRRKKIKKTPRPGIEPGFPA
jgi:hypothetical protein